MNTISKDIQNELNPPREIPVFKAGDNVTVAYLIREGDKQRIQEFRGDVIQMKGEGNTRTFTVRKMSSGVGVERVFPMFSPFIDSIKVNRTGKVRRARIYYIRELRGKAARIKEKRMLSTGK
jgi:large subunit ribosomal protein L19